MRKTYRRFSTEFKLRLVEAFNDLVAWVAPGHCRSEQRREDRPAVIPPFVSQVVAASQSAGTGTSAMFRVATHFVQPVVVCSTQKTAVNDMRPLRGTKLIWSEHPTVNRRIVGSSLPGELLPEPAPEESPGTEARTSSHSGCDAPMSSFRTGLGFACDSACASQRLLPSPRPNRVVQGEPDAMT